MDRAKNRINGSISKWFILQRASFRCPHWLLPCTFREPLKKLKASVEKLKESNTSTVLHEIEVRLAKLLAKFNRSHRRLYSSEISQTSELLIPLQCMRILSQDIGEKQFLKPWYNSTLSLISCPTSSPNLNCWNGRSSFVSLLCYFYRALLHSSLVPFCVHYVPEGVINGLYIVHRM